jgi:hypothetical protein
LFIDRNDSTPERGLTAEFEAWKGTGHGRLQIAPAVAGLSIRYLSGIPREDTRALMSEAISLANGIALSTGPPGSGKTTTLYAAIDRIRTGREKIVTIDDPIE